MADKQKWIQTASDHDILLLTAGMIPMPDESDLPITKQHDGEVNPEGEPSSASS